MHNTSPGCELSIKPVGPNNTDPGCCQQFVQHCLCITDTAFDESRFAWHDVNQNAVKLIAETLIKVAKQQPCDSNIMQQAGQHC